MFRSRCALGAWAAGWLLLGLASPAAPAPEAPQRARLGADLAAALQGPLPAAGLAVGVALRGRDLPAAAAERRAAIRARQERALAALPSGSFRLRWRYVSISGLAGWVQPAAIEALLAHPEVDFVYADGTVHATLAEGRALVGADSVNAQGFTGAGVRVAVLDSGIDTDHPHLADDLVAQRCFCDDHPSPQRGCCPGGGQSGSSAEDDEGHGTNVAGVLTSSHPQVPGVAPDAEIVAVKVLSSSGGGSFSDIAAGLDWVLTNRSSLGISVVNMSLGDGLEHDDASLSPCSGTNTANAIQALHAAGVSVFVSSGNEGHDDGISFPACVPEAISVGGVYDASLGSVSWCADASCGTILCTDSATAADRFVCHSNSDELLDILAPNWRTTTTALGGGAGSFGGTSASAPYAAGYAALLLDANASLTPDGIRTLLEVHGPAVVNSDNGLSFTRSDVESALVAALPAVCGNSSVESGEECDDGNTAGGDCCSSSCTFEFPGSACEDGDVCTASDACDASGICVPGAPLVCDDGQFCNGAESCDPGIGCLAGSPPVVDDGVACTDDDCDEPGDLVTHTANDALCEDGAFCNGVESCDPALGCQPGAAVDCADAVACTLDSCDEALDGCDHQPDDPSCDDGDPCTAELCHAVLGCASEPVPGCGAVEIPAGPAAMRVALGLALLVLGSAALVRRQRSRYGFTTLKGADDASER